MKRGVIIVLIIAAVGVGAGAYYMRRGGGEPQISTTPVTRGEIVDTVGSTGTLQAVTTVQVGSQVSGNISWLGADFNSIVKKGQVIARLDPSLFQAQAEQARANLTKARADVSRAESDVEHNKVAVTDAQQKYGRAKELAAKQLEPQADLDAAKIAVDSAQSMLQSSEAALNSSKAVVVQAQANLNQAQVNLDHCVITTPIDGIVIQRSVDVGQTVAASMQAPVLFIIAADLTKMQVNANIDEADVGRIRPGQAATFRVDAYPGEDFQGTVSQIRLQPVVVQNVTTYGTIVNVPNQDLKLKPGMTANLRVQIARRADVLRVPNAALRFRPTTDMFAALNQPVPPEVQFAGGRGGRGRGGQGAQGGGAAPGQGAPTQSAPGGSAASPGAGRAAAPAPAETAPLRGANTPNTPNGGRTSAPSTAGPSAPVSTPQGPRPDGAAGPGNFGQGGGEGRGGFGGGRGAGGFAGQGGGSDADRTARMMERFKTMSADEQRQFIARMKDRGIDTAPFEKAAQAAAPAAPKSKAPASAVQSKYGAPQSAETIDALFAPLQSVESQGRVWLAIDKQLKPVRLRLGITDGTNTELITGDLQQGQEVVTGVVLPSGSRPAAAQGTGNPLLPQGGRGPGGFGGGGFRGR